MIQVYQNMGYYIVHLVIIDSLHFFLGEVDRVRHGSRELEVYNIGCNGSEANLNECIITRVTESCSHSYDIQLNCYGNYKNDISYFWYIQM